MQLCINKITENIVRLKARINQMWQGKSNKDRLTLITLISLMTSLTNMKKNHKIMTHFKSSTKVQRVINRFITCSDNKLIN